MGYYVSLDEVDWEIKETPESLKAVREMPTKFHALKRGGSSNGEKWFSWMDDSEIAEALSVRSVFEALQFETEVTDDGFKILNYNSKTGQEDLFLAVLAPWTKDGSYMNWIGEDNAMWRYSVKDGKMFQEDCEIRWKNPAPYRYAHFVSDYSEQGSLRSKTYNVDINSEQHLEEIAIITQKAKEASDIYWDKYWAEKKAKEAEEVK